MQFAGYAPPLVVLCSKDLSPRTTPLTLQADEFGYVMNADQNVPRSMDRQRGNDDIEIVAVERPAARVKASVSSLRARADISEGPQDRFDPFVAVFDQAFQKRGIVPAYMKSGVRLAFDLLAP